MKRLLVYPASKEASCFARFGELVCNYDEVELVVPQGFGHNGDDFMTVDGGDPSYKALSTDFDKMLQESNDVLFLNSYVSLPSQLMEKRIREVLDADKLLYLDNIPGITERWKKSEGVVYLEDIISKKHTDPVFSSTEVYAIPVPVVFVLGTGPYTGKFDVQLVLRKHLLEKGYLVSSIGTKGIASFFGFDMLPNYLFHSSMSIQEKVIAINRYVYAKYIEERPDVMIIGVPGGIIPLNPIRFDYLGEMAFLLSLAIQPDAAVLCDYAHEYNQEYFDYLRKVCQYRLGAVVKHIVVSNTETSVVPETGECEFSTVPFSFIKDSFLQGRKYDGVEVFSLSDSLGMKDLAESLVDQLANNG